MALLTIPGSDPAQIEVDLEKIRLGSLANIAWIDWQKTSKNGVNYAAEPYLTAMMTLDSVDDAYGADDGRTIVAYFLANANSWRGENARLVKAELKRRLGR
jgi:hypothetical protein